MTVKQIKSISDSLLIQKMRDLEMDIYNYETGNGHPEFDYKSGKKEYDNLYKEYKRRNIDESKTKYEYDY